MNPTLNQIAVAISVLAANMSRADTNGFLSQVITLPATVSASRFADLDHDGHSDLIAVDPVEKKILIYRQHESGFANSPDQMIELPPQTAWIAPCDVDAHPGLELLISTATGIFYHRQNNGVFESQLRTLIKADQVFTNDDSPSLISLATNSVIPVISATQTILYQRNDLFEWKPSEPVALEMKHAGWVGNRNEWIMGANSSHGMFVQESFRQTQKNADEEKPENATIAKLIEDMKKAGSWHTPGINRVDLNGDGRMDLVLWQIVGDMDYRTDVYVFLRGADDKLPERPSQILHCRGIPVPVGNTGRPNPIGDLKGDGTHQLILLELKSMLTSASSLVEMALSRGVDLALTIRSFNHGAFSGSADASVVVKVLLTSETLEEWPMFVAGDFNGDGRPDFAVRRSATQWNILFSTNDGRWFLPQPAMTFETPVPGYIEVNDLNGDGRSDIVLRPKNDPRLFIFLTQATKGNR